MHLQQGKQAATDAGGRATLKHFGVVGRKGLVSNRVVDVL